MYFLPNFKIINLRGIWRKIQIRSFVRKATIPATPVCDANLSDRGTCVKDFCNMDECFTQPRVVIIGAGMAGLAAAARLAEKGITNYVVLEAYERPGGRILSCWLGDVVVELGSHWKQENNATHPVYLLSATEDPPRPGVPASDHPRGLFNTLVHSEMPFPPTITAYNKFRQIEAEAASIYCLGGSKQQGSLLNFMSLRIQQELHEYPEHQQHDAARIMFGLAHMLNARCPDDMGMLCSDHIGCYMMLPGGEVRVPLGLIAILAPLLVRIPEGRIRYCKPVTCVYWGTSQKAGHRAIVFTSDGEEYPADYVIVTASLGFLAYNACRMFCPRLPATKINAIQCLGYGCCNKVYLEYFRPFWYWHNAELNFNYCCGELACQPDWTRGITAIHVVPNSRHVLCAWISGPPARELETVCDKDVVEGLTGILRMSTGNPCLPYPRTILRSSWSNDPFFCGAYSYENKCSNGEYQAALGCPVPSPCEPVPPILLFAGEATVASHYATVSGARLSGIREAERILQLTRYFQGPPIPPEMRPKEPKKVKKESD